MKIIKRITKLFFNHPPRSNSSEMNVEKFTSPYITELSSVEGFKLLTVKTLESTNKHFYFMHGGGYTLEPISGHRKILLKLVDLGFKVTYIDYPLCPEYTASKTNEITLAGYKKLVESNPNDEFFFIGDSAGGGLAVSMLMQLRDSGFTKIPEKTVLLSPWFDVSEENEAAEEYDKIDKTLPIETLKDIGKKYAGTLGVKHPFVSPIYGNLENLGKFFIFFSDSEIMYPDCMKFMNLLKETEHTTADCYIEKKANHDYVMYASKEKTEEYYSIIKNFILGE